MIDHEQRQPVLEGEQQNLKSVSTPCPSVIKFVFEDENEDDEEDEKAKAETLKFRKAEIRGHPRNPRFNASFVSFDR